jgi:glycosyltransferase involved in cell wall biosynthesis
MRALFVIPARHLDGASRVLIDGAVALAARGNTSLVATVAGGEVERAAVQHGLPVTPLEARAGTVRRALALRVILAAHVVDVIFVDGASACLAAALASRWSRRGAVVQRITAGQAPDPGWRARLARSLATTGCLTSSAPSTSPVGDARFTLDSPLGVRVAAEAPDAGDNAGDPQLTCIGDGSPGGHRALGEGLRAFALLNPRFPRLRMVVVGDRRAADDPDARLHAAALGVAERVEWISGAAPRAAALARSTVGFVAAEGDDGVYGWLELMALGVPFVARRTVLAERYVSHGIHGALLASLDPPRAAAELALFLSSPSRRRAMGAAARSRVAREFNDRTTAVAFEQIARRVHGRTS